MELNSAFGASEFGSSFGSSGSSALVGKRESSSIVVDKGDGLFVCFKTPFQIVGDDLEVAALLRSWKEVGMSLR